MELLSALNQDGHTIIMITHDINIARFGSRFVRLLDVVLSEGGPDDV